MADLTASRRNPTIKAFYDQLLAGGKLPNGPIVASMRKLLAILKAMVRTHTAWNRSLHGA